MGQLADVLMSKGYGETDALNAERLDDGRLAQEYLGGSSSGGSTTGGQFNFNQAEVEKQAKEQLRPYYERLLKIYDGNIALAKKRIEEDYARGLRYNSEETANALGDNQQAKEESARKFKLALGDLDQEMNSRGMTNSGIKATNVQNANADQAFKENQYANTARDLTLAEKKANEELDVKRKRFMEENGFADPGVSGYINERQQKLDELGHAFEGDVATKVGNAYTREANIHTAGITPLQDITPTNYTELLNKGLTMSGLPATT